jgi:carboxyl-terminal processing protease
MKAGVREGDLIIRVDGEDCAGMSFIELVSGIRGKIGSSVELTLRRVGTGETDVVQVTRDRVTLDSVSSKTIEPGIGYLEIKLFDERCLEEVRQGLEALKGEGELKALILDVRGNMGGLLKQAVDVSDLFLSAGVIARLESRLAAERVTFEAHPEVEVPPDVVVVVLADGQSASAAEVFAGALQSNGRATVIGTKTFGKGSVNRQFRLPDGSGLYLTVAHYTVGPGKAIEGKGIEPDVEVGRLSPYPEDGGTEARDKWLAAYRAAKEEQFVRALQFVKEKMQ